MHAYECQCAWLSLRSTALHTTHRALHFSLQRNCAFLHSESVVHKRKVFLSACCVPPACYGLQC